MTDRWTRAEERYRQNAERRYRRDDLEWSEADDYEDDTTVIPRYEDERYDDDQYEGDEYDDEPPLAPEPPRRAAPQRADRVGRRGADRRGAERTPRAGARAAGGRGQRPKRSRMASRKAAERKRRRRNLFVIAGVFAVLFVGAVGFAGWKFIGKLNGPADFSGPQGPLVVIQIKSGDTATQIAQTMADKGVVASSGAFYEAAVRNTNMSSIQPGYYAVPSHSKGAEAVTALFGKDARVGNVVISEGRQLHDSSDVSTGARKDGIYRKIAEASCVGTGPSAKCVTYEQLDQAGAGDPVALGVPTWALERVKTAPDRNRQLEGLIAGGTLDFDPTASPQDILKQLVTMSAQSYEASGLLQSGAANGLTPYDTLISASLVEREALPQDMSKVARVIVNRLAAQQPLQFDSTVNYNLAQTEVATTDADRAKKTPWNTYAMPGLPATPISAPSLDAMRAMENPAPGPWLYFVTVDKQGTTLFTDDYKEHLRNIEKARQSGILDSGR
ncbi:endolytic transglycosylase MltG [Nocardia sp. CDC153]|uniref:endolytic transglycosylase MltG n=1 Tax=Nocardia sp. CDC153 TaxID=3112167 RepID=UPI002DBD7F0C|nr:endolytic transglycosylase MltG [Nocardia sp. CDC153]MEC3953477.1 endolytic transglycosylase MltG [Nocardia sp. CDC153]